MSTPPQILSASAAEQISSNGREDTLAAPPPAPTLASAVGRHRWLIVSLAVLCAAIGVGVGVSQRSAYTASSALQVGKENPNSPGFYGYVQSASALAAVYSRALTAAPVIATVQQKLGISPTTAVERLSAEPIPNSPVFRIIATGASAHAAVELANVAAGALVSYESHNNYSSDAAELYGKYRTAATELARDRGQLAQLERSKTPPESPRRVGAQATVYTAQARSNALNGAYQQAVAAEPSGSLVSPLSSAIAASNDHKSKIELLGLIGLVGGLIIGCALAVLLEQRKRLTV